MTRSLAPLLALAFTPLLCRAQSESMTLPAGTPLPVQTDEHLPMRVGTPIRAHLLYPVYAGATLLIPENTTFLGSIVDLRPDRSRRIRARFNADFTPFHTPVVRFTQLQLTDGTTLAITSGDASHGAPLFRIVAPPPRKGGFLRQQIDQGKQVVRDQIAVVTGPDKKDRIVRFLYSQLPYHPERIAKGTAWTVETTAPLTLSQLPAQPAKSGPPPASGETPGTWMLQAYLNQELNSATTKPGQSIKATIAEPIYNPDGTVAIPEGATLLGAVTKSRPARRFARAGALSFSFRQLVLPDGKAESVQASLKGADSASSADLALNSEGEVKPKPKDKIIAPLLLIFLSTRPLDRDGGEHMLGKDAVASNSLGSIGFVVGIAARQANLAAGIGAYGTALTLYDRWFARGKDVTFPRDTRLVIQTTARRSEAIKPDATTR